eukprot:scaffold20657_cov134-Isochrysis_galbana.AAC.2
MLVVATGSFGMPITVDGHFGQTAPPQHSQPILNIYAPGHACAQPQHAPQSGSAPAAQAQAALSEIAKQQPLQRPPSGWEMSVPQAAGQTREPPSPLSGSDSAFNAVGPQLTKSNSFRAREEQTCAAQVRRRSLGRHARDRGADPPLRAVPPRPRANLRRSQPPPLAPRRN